MSWNNGKEHDKFEREQTRLKQQYISAGMTDEQIQEMYDYDKAILNSNRREAEHSGDIDFEIYAETNGIEMDITTLSRYAWLDEIQDKRISEALKYLSDKDKELLTKYIIDGYKWHEIAKMEGVRPQTISNRLKK